MNERNSHGPGHDLGSLCMQDIETPAMQGEPTPEAQAPASNMHDEITGARALGQDATSAQQQLDTVPACSQALGGQQSLPLTAAPTKLGIDLQNTQSGLSHVDPIAVPGDNE
jgi:hypothetical protein